MQIECFASVQLAEAQGEHSWCLLHDTLLRNAVLGMQT